MKIMRETTVYKRKGMPAPTNADISGGHPTKLSSKHILYKLSYYTTKNANTENEL